MLPRSSGVKLAHFLVGGVHFLPKKHRIRAPNGTTKKLRTANPSRCLPVRPLLITQAALGELGYVEIQASPKLDTIPIVAKRWHCSGSVQQQQFPLMPCKSYASMVADSSDSVSTIRLRLLKRFWRSEITGRLLESEQMS